MKKKFIILLLIILVLCCVAVIPNAYFLYQEILMLSSGARYGDNISYVRRIAAPAIALFALTISAIISIWLLVKIRKIDISSLALTRSEIERRKKQAKLEKLEQQMNKLKGDD